MYNKNRYSSEEVYEKKVFEGRQCLLSFCSADTTEQQQSRL